MTCHELEAALTSEDPAAIAAARDHATRCPRCGPELQIWDDLSAAARSLHREWESPALWSRIEASIRSDEVRSRQRRDRAAWRWLPPWLRQGSPAWRRDGLPRWPRWGRALATAVIVLAAVVPLAWFGWRLASPGASLGGDEVASERLLSEDALIEVERAEAQYVRAIDALARVAAAEVEASASPLLMNLHERLITIDAAIAECHAEIARNPFNAHLRRQLLFVYQQKQRTLEHILEQEHHAS